MYNFLRILHDNDIELKIDKAPGMENVIRYTLRSDVHCMVRYFNLNHPAAPELGGIVADLYLFYKEFMDEKKRKEYLAETLVSTFEQEQIDFLKEGRGNPDTYGGDIGEESGEKTRTDG